jgi:hypothetical protein
MNYQEILEALNRGETVHWKNRLYTVKCNFSKEESINDYSRDDFHRDNAPKFKRDGGLLICHENESCEGILLDGDNKISSHSENDFYISRSPSNLADIGRIIPHLYKRLMGYKSKMELTYFKDYFIRIEMGAKYFKLFACEVMPDGKVNSGRIVCFIDKNSGDIYKPATYKTPAKHARGNVDSDQYGMEAFNEDGWVIYLK